MQVVPKILQNASRRSVLLQILAGPRPWDDSLDPSPRVSSDELELCCQVEVRQVRLINFLSTCIEHIVVSQDLCLRSHRPVQRSALGVDLDSRAEQNRQTRVQRHDVHAVPPDRGARRPLEDDVRRVEALLLVAIGTQKIVVLTSSLRSLFDFLGAESMLGDIPQLLVAENYSHALAHVENGVCLERPPEFPQLLNELLDDPGLTTLRQPCVCLFDL
mmetsp:Transcript_83939/g.211646  ORF Transcript_83939/g.211646 Transcript_83939/m.211646 type:complete len:217 (-) Transcript_83939:587-1237(-)